MLRIEEVNLVGPPRHQIPHVVQPPGKAPQAGGSFTALRAWIAFVVTTASEDSRRRQVFNTSDSLCYIGKVFTGARHHSVLQSSRSPLDTLANSDSQCQKNSVSLLQSPFLRHICGKKSAFCFMAYLTCISAQPRYRRLTSGRVTMRSVSFRGRRSFYSLQWCGLGGHP